MLETDFMFLSDPGYPGKTLLSWESVTSVCCLSYLIGQSLLVSQPSLLCRILHCGPLPVTGIPKLDPPGSLE